MAQRKYGTQSDSGDKLARLAKEALQAFREDNPDAYKELVQAYDGKSADLALLGHGRFHVSVSKGEVEVLPNEVRGKGVTGLGATTPETLMAIVEGRITPLEAFFKGDIVARAHSDELHQAYNYFVRFSEAALRSKRLQKVASEFRDAIDSSGMDRKA